MNKAISSGQKKTIIIVLGVVMALLIGVLTTSTVVVIKASEGEDLPLHNKKDLSKPLGSDSNPFTILEIVPDVASATVGYLNRGTAPGESDDYTLLRIGVTDRNEEGSAANIYEKAFASGNSPASQMGDPEISHLFERDIETIDFVDFTVKYDEYQGMGTSDRNKGFSEFGYFTKVNSEAGSYVYNTNAKRFEPMNPFNKDSYDHFEWTSLGEFKHVGQGGVATGRVACTRDMYSLDGQPRQFSYDNGVRRESESVPVNGAVGDKAYRYYYSSIGDFEWVPNSNYNNEDIFIENASDQSIREARENDKLYMTRTENVYYEFEASPIVSNDMLAKELKEFLGDSNKDLTNFKTDVITVTPAQLDVSNSNQNAMNIIDDADMIIIHDSSVGYRIKCALDDKEVVEVPRFIKTNGGSGDLPYETVKYIINRGAGYDRDNNLFPAAIVIDDDAINTANSYGENSSSNCTNLKLLCDIYNNLGAKLAYNLSPSGDNYVAKLSTMENDSEYKSYYRKYDYNNRGEFKDALGKSNFVYNYEGKDDSWITTDFANNNKINNNNETMPAFENVGGGQTMSVARMMAAVYKESQGYNQPKSLRLLELQPNEKFYYNVLDKDSWVKKYVSLFPWFIGTDKDIGNGDVEGDGDVKITKMPTYEFIGRNEDINENYDMIIVGNKVQDETNGKLGYNDKALGSLVYTAVGDLITTFGGDVDDPNENQDSYKWHYGLFGGLNADDNIWSWTQNAFTWDRSGLFILDYWKDWKIYKDYPNFRKAFVYEYFHYRDGENITAGYDWWYEKNPDGGWFANGFPIYACKHGSDANMIGLRYSGNDLTKKKYDQLLDFSNQGPVIIADNLYGNNSDEPNKAIIDQSSFVYQLAKKDTPASSVSKYAHGVSDKLNNNKRNMTKYTCSATFTNDESGQPREYDQNTNGLNYNTQRDIAGNNILQYHFVLEGDKDATYGVNVYTDSNGNGVFEDCISYEKERQANNGKKGDSEKAPEASLTIFDETNKGFVTDGNLKAGNSYIVTRVLPTSDVGMIPWKIELYNKGNDSIRFSETGYTRIQSLKKATINVLQMNPQPSMQNNATPTVNFSQNATFNRLKQNLPDFNINVTYMSNQDWWINYGANNKTKAWKEELMKYDMLIIGCKDSASFTNDETYIYGFNEFVEAGKAVILTHDLVADVTIGMTSSAPHYLTDQMVQSDVRYYLRELLGQMRKYYDAESYATSNNNNYSYMDYKSNGRSLSLKPKDNFKIYTSIHETRHYFAEIYDNYMTLEPHDNYNYTPVYDKYTYVYGNFDNKLDGKSLKDDGTYLLHPDHREMAITTKINYVRDYYTRHGYQPACMIMDNSVRAMFFYNYIYYVEDKKYSPDGKTTGFIDKIDRTVKNVDLNNRDQRRRLVWGGDGFETNRVQKANEGQITKYPFAINDTINVANTHVQNYQLDLEYDDDGDVLVWYNLIGKNDANAIDVYSGKNQDSRNNYYIYTKGGITYTGLGHSGNVTEDEMKLFINTMIAAYRSGAADPYIRVVNEDAITSGDNTTMYLEDRDIGSDGTIRYRIADDTTNSKIVRTYSLEVYKEGQLIQTIDSANLLTEYTIPVSFSDVKANGEVKYKIILRSTYHNNLGVDVRTESEQNVNVDLMPMFGLR